MYVPEEQHVQVLINALPEDIREAVEDLQPEIGEEVQTICNFLDELVEEEPKKELLEEARNHLYSITFRHTDLRPLHSYIQRTSKLVATLFEQDCNSDLVEQIATFHCIMRMPKDLAAAFFKHLEKKKEVLCKESLHNWAARNKTSIHQRLVPGKGDKDKNMIVEKKRDTPKIIGPSHWTIKALIGNVKLSTTMYLDSCSGFNYLSMKSWKDLGEPSLDLLDTVEIKDVGANIISCLGALAIPVVLDNIEHTCKFYVWEHECDIIGFGDLKLLWFIGCESIEKKLENCAQVRVPNLSMSFDVSKDFKPCVMPFRKLKPNVQDLVKQRLEEEYYTRINKIIIIPEAQDNISIKNILQFRKKDVRYLSSIDLKDAYKQFTIHGKNRELATINTPFGFYEPLRVVFGIAFVPALFNNALADLIDSIPDTYRYFDDIVVISKTESGHRAALSQLLQVFEENNIVCNRQKSQIMVNFIDFLGFCISSNGTIQTSNKIKDSTLDSPTDSTSLRGALAKMSYTRLFIPDFAKLAKPLYPKKNFVGLN